LYRRGSRRERPNDHSGEQESPQLRGHSSQNPLRLRDFRLPPKMRTVAPAPFVNPNRGAAAFPVSLRIRIGPRRVRLRWSATAKYLSSRDGLHGIEARYRLPEQFTQFPGRIVEQSVVRDDPEWSSFARADTFCHNRRALDIGAARGARGRNDVQVAVRVSKVCGSGISCAISGSGRQSSIATFDEHILEFRGKPIPRWNENRKGFPGECLVQYSEASREFVAHIVDVPGPGVFGCRFSFRRVIPVNPSMHEDVDVTGCMEAGGEGGFEMAGNDRKPDGNAGVRRKGKQAIQGRRTRLRIVVPPPEPNDFVGRKSCKGIGYGGHQAVSAS
jgi:hypothetical protein